MGIRRPHTTALPAACRNIRQSETFVRVMNKRDGGPAPRAAAPDQLPPQTCPRPRVAGFGPAPPGAWSRPGPGPLPERDIRASGRLTLSFLLRSTTLRRADPVSLSLIALDSRRRGPGDVHTALAVQRTGARSVHLNSALEDPREHRCLRLPPDRSPVRALGPLCRPPANGPGFDANRRLALPGHLRGADVRD